MTKVYMSLSTKGIGFSYTQINVWKLSLALAKKHYGEVSLITDSDGANILQDLPFDNVIIQLNDIPNYNTIWSLGKIYAYKYICGLNEPFLHLDGDVFLWEKLPENLTDSAIFVQSKDEKINEHNIYNIFKLQADLNCALPYEWITSAGLQCYNMGIFGGANLTLINNYCDFVINMINNPLYANLWNGVPGVISNNSNDNFNSSNTKATMVEQGNFGIYCHNNNITPSLFFNNISDDDNITYKKYTHLILNKNEPAILERIAARLSKIPYDLTVREVPLSEWHNFNYVTEPD